MNKPLSYKPSCFYYRKALRECATREEALSLGLEIADENERLREWCRAQGMMPPKWFITPAERAAKAAHPGAAIPFPRKDAGFGKGA